ncbi:hypothetical protein A3Q56_06874 [Intoshia linei]|uniref:Cation efflux protein transmembrane domain-containing protein n=1 Tax=Intoshia linei TaxID=1819745 RepID=A0A177ATV8_9BILA|nr:hypothetical protein A3Q56_06874 [Intoshia linei]
MNSCKRKNQSLCQRETRGFYLMIFISTSYFIVELIFGYYTNSLSLISDAYHMFGEIIGFCIGLISIIFSKKYYDSKNDKYSYGRCRAQFVGALVNSVFRIFICFTIIIKVLSKFFSIYIIINSPGLVTEHQLHSKHFIPNHHIISILFVAIFGLIINIIGFFVINHSGRIIDDKKNAKSHKTRSLLSEKSSNGILCASAKKGKEYMDNIINFKVSPNLNIRGVLLHVVGDILGSILIIVNVLLMLLVEQHWIQYIDPICSLLMVVILTFASLSIRIANTENLKTTSMKHA